MNRVAGIDIGGTKTAVSLVEIGGGAIRLIDRDQFATPDGPEATLRHSIASLQGILSRSGLVRPDAVGVSCGGPLDSRRGLILSPPNLPGWDRVDVLSPFEDKFGSPTALLNDANAGALAEWRWGAGRGCRNMIFLTFGTGLGAGLILDGRLYAGLQDLAGEVGHIRLAPDGPVGYGKAGSFEGFCSGGGIARFAAAHAEVLIASGQPPGYCSERGELGLITAQKVAEWARSGDPAARHVFAEAGRQLGRGLAVLIDLLNPERVIIGGIFSRQRELLEPAMWEALRDEALPQSLAACRVFPSGLGERIGDYAAAAAAMQALEEAYGTSINQRTRTFPKRHAGNGRGIQHDLHP